jgi:hypothetical protein
MAFGLPVEGADGPFLGADLVPVPTCDVTLTVADALAALEDAAEGEVLVLTAGDLAVGEVDAGALACHDEGLALLDVLRPVPTTVRPSVTVASVAGGGGGALLVTSSDGRLLGRAVVEPQPGDHEGHDHAGHDHDDHEGHDHEGHDHGEAGEHEAEIAEIMQAVADRFGEREPSPEELRAFLRERLVAEGQSEEEADGFLDNLLGGEEA